ncbi:PH domain-containing protein [Polyangium sp. 6x1]|uniref:PH domain-containing protein n=1 Tax=Polyangium sp. 6x1 TaxID=3042689 RepID=UPI0024831921|nr:PH domain-containing protein [Polyangium sp. 6x1]MDI1449998.1 PH domain-containing protein [Polyangium sp. 6x1]
MNAPALDVPKVRATVQTFGLGRLFARASFLAAFAPPLVAWILWLVVPQSPAVQSCMSFAWFSALAASPLLAAASALFAMSQGYGSGGESTIRVDRRGVVFDMEGRARDLSGERIESAYVVPKAGVRLALVGGNVVFLAVPDEALAKAIVERLGFRPDKRRVTLHLGSPQWMLAAACMAAVVVWGASILSYVVASGTSSQTVSFVSLLLLVFLTPLLTWLSARALKPEEMVVGGDGILVRRPFGKHYYPLADIEAVHVRHDRLVLRLRGQEKTVAKGEPALLAAAARRIQSVRAADPRERAAGVANLLDRQGRPLDQWRAALSALVRDGDYRHATITPEVLWSVLEDHKEEPSRRLGAAMLLRKSEPKAAQRIRIAADVCADDDVRAALERAAEDEIDEATLAKAVMKRP